MTSEVTKLENIRKSKANPYTLTPFVSFYMLALVMFCIVTLPSLHTLSFVASWYNEKRLWQIIILITLTATLIFSSHIQNYVIRTINRLPKIEKVLFIVFICFGITSSLVSSIPTWAFTELSNFMLLGLLSLFISYSVSNNTQAEKIIVVAFCTSVALYFIAFVASLVAGLSYGVIDYQNLISGFINRRFLNQFQSISLPILLLAPFLLNVDKKRYFLLSLISAFWFMLILVSDGRGVLAASLIGIIFSSIIIPYSRAKWLLHTTFVVLLGILLFIGFDYLLSNNEVISGDVFRETSGGRLIIWLQLLEVIKENPILGIGPMHYAILPHSFTVAHPHNITLQLMGEFGIPAAISIIFIVIASFIRWVKHQRKVSGRNQSLTSTALTASFIAAIIHGHLSGVFVMPLSQLSFVIICGWMISISDKSTALTSPTSFSIKQRGTLIFLTGLALTALLIGTYSHIQSLIVDAPLKAANPGISYPAANASRYWSGTYR